MCESKLLRLALRTIWMRRRGEARVWSSLFGYLELTILSLSLDWHVALKRSPLCVKISLVPEGRARGAAEIDNPLAPERQATGEPGAERKPP